MKRTAAERRGVALIWTGISAPAFMAMVGVAVDGAWSNLTAQQLQNTADAAALAAARLVRQDESAARLAAVGIAALNFAGGDNVVLDLNAGNSTEGDIVFGKYNRSSHNFVPQANNRNAVQVTVRRSGSSANGELPLIFGPAFGFNSIEMSRSAIAMVEGDGLAGGVIVLDPNTSCACDIGGNGSLYVYNGNIQINSDDCCAFCTNGGPYILADEINVVGHFCTSTNSDIEADLQELQPAMDDPLENLPDPPQGATQPAVPKKTTMTIQPGYYPNGIERTGGTLTCAPGIYYIDGASGNCNSLPGFSVNGNANVVAYECMFFMNKGKVDFRGTGDFDITPPVEGTYEGISFFQARTNSCQSQFNGNSVMSILGIVYFPEAQLKVNGTAEGTSLEQVIVKQLYIIGNGTVHVNPAGATPTSYDDLFLVE